MIDVPNHSYQACLLKKKQYKNSFIIGRSKITTQLLELVLINIYDPDKVISLSDNKYILTFIDDFYKKKKLGFIY